MKTSRRGIHLVPAPFIMIEHILTCVIKIWPAATFFQHSQYFTLRCTCFKCVWGVCKFEFSLRVTFAPRTVHISHLKKKIFFTNRRKILKQYLSCKAMVVFIYFSTMQSNYRCLSLSVRANNDNNKNQNTNTCFLCRYRGEYSFLWIIGRGTVIPFREFSQFFVCTGDLAVFTLGNCSLQIFHSVEMN